MHSLNINRNKNVDDDSDDGRQNNNNAFGGFGGIGHIPNFGWNNNPTQMNTFMGGFGGTRPAIRSSIPARSISAFRNNNDAE